MNRTKKLYKSVLAATIFSLLFIAVCIASAGEGLIIDPSLMKEFDHRIDKIRKGRYVIRFVDSQGNPIQDGEITLSQTAHEFRFGGSVFTPLFEERPSPLNKERLLKRAAEMFNIIVDGNGFKWQNIEPSPGNIEYGFNRHQKSIQWAAAHNMAVRHHCLFWADPKFNPEWLLPLGPDQLRSAMFNRIEYTRNHIGYDIRSLDVINELLYFRFYRDRLGEGIVKEIFEKAKAAFPNARLYLNEFPTQKGKYFGCYDTYIAMIRKLQAEEVPFSGVGLQAHFDKNSILSAHMGLSDFLRNFNAAIDKLSQASGLPVFITEFSMKSKDETLRADFLEAFYTMAFSNNNVEGILVWEWFDEAKYKALVRYDGSLTPAGKKYYDLVLSKWHTKKTFSLDHTGAIETDAFFGDYTVTLRKGTGSCSERITLGKDAPKTITIEMNS